MTKKRLALLLGGTVAAIALIFGVFVTLPAPTVTKTPAAKKPVVKVATDLDQIFDPSKVSQTFIDLPAKSQATLNNIAETAYVPATFRMIYNGHETQAINVGIKLKGTTTRSTLSNTWYRPSFKIKFDWAKGYKTQTLFGLKELTLNGFNQDSSRLHETYAYESYRAMGIPAPRTGFTTITFEGKSTPNTPNRGLYLVLESEDDVFFGANFKDVTQHVYENNHDVTDFDAAKIGGNTKVSTYFKVKQGWNATPNKDDLKAFVKAINTSGETFWNNLDKVADRNELIMLFAVDNFTGNWDTYSGPMRNNFTFRSNVEGKFTFVPWGTDQSFGENLMNDSSARQRFADFQIKYIAHDDFFMKVDSPYTSYPGSYIFAHSAGVTDYDTAINYPVARGKIFAKCLAVAECSTLYFQDLQKVNEWSKQVGMADQMAKTNNLIASLLNQYQKTEGTRTSKWVTKQQLKIDDAINKHCKLNGATIVSCSAIS